MLFARRSSSAGVLPWGLTFLSLLSLGSTSPTPVDVHVTNKPQHDLIFREALELAHQPHLEKRLQADFSLEKTWPKNHVLFAGSWVNTGAPLGVTDSVSLSVVCVDCWTKGIVSAKLTEDIVDPTVRLDFHGVEAYVDIDVDITAGAAYAVNLFTSQSPLGLGFPGLSLGLVFYVDLVFALTAEIDLEGGFYVQVEEGSFLETSILGGDVTDSLFDGLKSKSIPVTVRKGSATFKADLRLRVQCGAQLGVEGSGLEVMAEVGIYANLIEFVAVLESTPTCALQSTEWWDLNVGAFARFGVVVDYKTFGVVPTVSTTLLSAPTMTQCWLEIGAGAGNGAVITATTAPAGALSSPPVSVRPSSTAGVSGGIGGSYSSHGSYYESGGSVPTAAPSSSMSDAGTTGSPMPSSANPIFPTGNSSLYPVYTSGTVSLSPSSPSAAPPDGTYPTTTYILTSCAALVPNCPNSLQHVITVTKTLQDVYPTFAPTPNSQVPTGTSTTTCTKSSTTAVITPIAVITKDIIVLQPCKTPITSTFTYTPPGATGPSFLPTSSLYSSGIPKNGYQFPNGSSITTVLGFSTLAPSEVITATSTSISTLLLDTSGAFVTVSVPAPSEYPVLETSSSSPSLPTPSVVTAGAAGLGRSAGVGTLLAGGVVAGVWLW
ncbi:hypothetical protein V8F20_002237 [Naviculisporaceae sp. PSN 640]